MESCRQEQICVILWKNLQHKFFTFYGVYKTHKSLEVQPWCCSQDIHEPYLIVPNQAVFFKASVYKQLYIGKNSI